MSSEPPTSTYSIRQYGLEQGALEIQYIEEFFGEFPHRKTAAEIVERLQGRPHSILMAETRLPDDPTVVIPVAYKVSHEVTGDERDPKLADLVARIRDAVDFSSRRVLYSWIGGTRSDWRGRGFYRALTEEQEGWALTEGFDVIVVKTKNRFHHMRGTLAHLAFEIVKFERHPEDNGESKLYLAKRLGAEVLRSHRSTRSVVRVD